MVYWQHVGSSWPQQGMVCLVSIMKATASPWAPGATSRSLKTSWLTATGSSSPSVVKKNIFLEFSVIFLKITAETLQKFIAYLPPQLLSEQAKIFTSIYTSLRVYNVTFDSLYIL